MKHLRKCLAIILVSSIDSFSSPLQYASIRTAQRHIQKLSTPKHCRNHAACCLLNSAPNLPTDDVDDSNNNPTKKVNVQGGDALVPSIQRIINFAIPAIGIYLCSPLLSTIDTASVGQLRRAQLKQELIGDTETLRKWQTTYHLFNGKQ